jgi:phosphatidate cytidylyltransferase
MAPPAERPSSDRAGGPTNLQKRILSAAVLLPLVIAAIHFGHPFFAAVIAVFGGTAAWEWARVAASVRPDQGTISVPNPPKGLWSSVSVLSGLAVVAVVQFIAFPSAREVIVVAAVGLIWLGLTCLSFDWHRIGWSVPGIVYVAAAAAALVVLRGDPQWGRATLVWIIALVVAADTGGYLVGRTVGGPKLAPRISPNKTWSGLGGAVAGAALAGLCTAFILNHTNVWMLTLISAVLGLLEQGGDLVESAFKRHFGVKDTSQIIPGHGGVLDRVDGLLAVAVAVLVINLWAGGSVLAW